MRHMVKLLKRSDGIRAAARNAELRVLNCVEAVYDFRYGIDTRSNDLSPAFRDDEGYDPISYPGLGYLRDHVGLLPGEVFFDIGCGRGRALCLFSRDPAVERCIGIEYHPDHARIARQNATRVRARSATIEIIQGDAAAQDYDDATLILMYNPFGAATMRKTMQCIERSVRRCPRHVRILYANPKHDHVLEEQPWLTRIRAFQIPNRIHRSLPCSLWMPHAGATASESRIRVPLATPVL
jgi:SAM-dependent methyltransferase